MSARLIQNSFLQLFFIKSTRVAIQYNILLTALPDDIDGEAAETPLMSLGCLLWLP